MVTAVGAGVAKETLRMAREVPDKSDSLVYMQLKVHFESSSDPACGQKDINK